MLRFPIDCDTPAKRTEYCYRAQELLRLRHNKEWEDGGYKDKVTLLKLQYESDIKTLSVEGVSARKERRDDDIRVAMAPFRKWQEDWGEEFGGDNPEKLRKLNEKYYRPYRAVLGRAPKGRHGYQGRVERSHRTDDEEFYIPLLLSIKNENELLRYARKWLYWYNVKRPHFGKDMDGKLPFEKLKEYYSNLPEQFVLLPPIILDDVSTFWAIRGGNDLLTPYNVLSNFWARQRKG